MKRIAAFLCILVIGITSAGCLVGGLPDGFDEQRLYDDGLLIVQKISERDYAYVVDRVRDDVKDELTYDALKAAFDPVIDQYGAYQEIKSYTVYATTDANYGDEEFGSVCYVVKHADKNLTYEITYDVEMMIVGIYIYQSI